MSFYRRGGNQGAERDEFDAPITVLHVDDEPEFTELASTFLERVADHIEVVTEHDADAALSRLAGGSIDCVVSDYDMPGTDGLEFLAAVRERYPGLPFVLFTGKGSEEIASEAVSAGVSDYLQKAGGSDQFELLANRIENFVRRARAERELDRRIAAIETANEGISLLDDDGRFVYVNRAYAEVFGYEPDEMVGEHWAVIYPEEDLEFVREELLPIARERGWAGRSRHVRKDGEEIVTQHAVSFTATGDMVCTVRDVTVEERTAGELFVKERAMDAAPIGITLTDPSAADNPIVYANEGFERLTGYDEEDVLGQNCRFLQGENTDPDDVAALRAGIEAERHVSVEVLNYRADGTSFWNQVDVAPVYDESGDLANFVGFQRDVTERKEAKREREAVLDRISDAFFALDSEWQFTYLNDQAEALLEREREDLIGASVWEEFPEAVGTTFYEEYHAAMETQEPVAFVEHYEPLSTWFEVNAYPSETGLSVYFRDVSERQEHERNLERRANQHEAFGDVLAHDLRSPLNAIEGRIDLAMETGETAHLEAASAVVDRVHDLVSDLADVMREGRLVDDLGPVDLESCLRSTWAAIESGDATIAVASSREVVADESALRRLFENLLRNAVEHGGDDVTIRAGVTADGFYLEDDGPGVPPEDRDRVFEPGFSTKSEGTGFGMASVRQIALAHGWAVSATEGRDGGARFEVTDVRFSDVDGS